MGSADEPTGEIFLGGQPAPDKPPVPRDLVEFFQRLEEIVPDAPPFEGELFIVEQTPVNIAYPVADNVPTSGSDALDPANLRWRE